MSSISLIALASPILPASLLIASLRARGALDVLAPAQFALLIGGAMLAARVEHTPGVVGAAATVLFAMIGLSAVVMRKDGIARRAAYSFDWEQFERDFQFYAIVAGFR